MQLKRYNVVSFAKQHGDLMHFYRNLSAWFSVARRFRHCWRTSTACETSWPEYLPTETFLCHLRHVTERKACGKCQTYQIVAKRVILSLAHDQGGYHIFIYWGVKLYTWRQKWNRFIRKSEQLMVYLGGWFVLQCWCSDLLMHLTISCGGCSYLSHGLCGLIWIKSVGFYASLFWCVCDRDVEKCSLSLLRITRGCAALFQGQNRLRWTANFRRKDCRQVCRFFFPLDCAHVCSDDSRCFATNIEAFHARCAKQMLSKICQIAFHAAFKLFISIEVLCNCLPSTTPLFIHGKNTYTLHFNDPLSRHKDLRVPKLPVTLATVLIGQFDIIC